MKKKVIKKNSSEILPEYDFSKGIKGKYAKNYMHSNNIVVIAKDVARYFSDSDSVNDALRTVLRVVAPRKKRAA